MQISYYAWAQIDIICLIIILYIYIFSQFSCLFKKYTVKTFLNNDFTYLVVTLLHFIDLVNFTKPPIYILQNWRIDMIYDDIPLSVCCFRHNRCCHFISYNNLITLKTVKSWLECKRFVETQKTLVEGLYVSPIERPTQNTNDCSYCS